MDTEFCVHYVTEEAVACSVSYKENPRAFFEDSFLHLVNDQLDTLFLNVFI